MQMLCEIVPVFGNFKKTYFPLAICDNPQLPESTDAEGLVVYDKIHFINVFPNYKAFLDKLYLVLKDAILIYY